MIVAIVTGSTGRDGAHLGQMSLENGDDVHATPRQSRSPDVWPLELLGRARWHLRERDIGDPFAARLSPAMG